VRVADISIHLIEALEQGERAARSGPPEVLAES
jgi:hypothetical protein